MILYFKTRFTKGAYLRCYSKRNLAIQSFDYTKNGQLKLRGYEWCLTAGNESTSTYSPQDCWRVLSLENCLPAEQVIRLGIG